MRLGRIFTDMKVFTGVKRGARLSVIVLSAVLASACAAGGYSTSALRSRLVDAGLRPEQATCVLDKMVGRFGRAQLNARTAPIAAELRAEKILLRACGVSKPK